MTPAKRVAAVVCSRIGDTLLATPALRAVKENWPDCHLTVYAHPKRREVLENLPFIDRLRGLDWLARIKARLGLGPRYDLALVFNEGETERGFAARQAEQTVWFAKTPSCPPEIHVAPPEQLIHAVHERLMLPEALGLRSEHWRLAYQVSEAEDQAGRAWLEAATAATGIHHGRPFFVALQLKSFPTKSHRDWPLTSFQALLERISRAVPEVVFVITGDQASVPSAEVLAEMFPTQIVVAAGKLSLRQTAAVLKQCRLYIGVDTGPTHLAGALGIPMVALYHPAYPGQFLAPLQHPRCRVVLHPLTGVSLSKEADMGEIGVDQVWHEVSSLLAELRP